jgi:hypothetical protein
MAMVQRHKENSPKPPRCRGRRGYLPWLVQVPLLHPANRMCMLSASIQMFTSMPTANQEIFRATNITFMSLIEKHIKFL